jgi:hypothetical protein
VAYTELRRRRWTEQSDLVEVLCHGALLLLRLLVRVEADGDLGAERQALLKSVQLKNWVPVRTWADG